MKGHHARGPEETVQDLSPLVSSGAAGRRPATRLRPPECQAARRRKTAASARRSHRGATGDEVPGASGARQPGPLRADGRRVRPASLRGAAGRATLRRLARRLARGPRAHPGRAGAVLENAAAAARPAHNSSRRARTRLGAGRCQPRARSPAPGPSHAGDGRPATGTNAVPDRNRAPGARSDDAGNGKGARSRTC